MSEPATGTGETVRLASFCADMAYDDLDRDVVASCTRALADTLAACYAGTKTEAGGTILEYVLTVSGDGEAAVIGPGGRTLPHFAALANGTTAHALDVDDGHRVASAHPGAAVIPAALATAEAHGGTGADLVTAIAVGYEAMVKTAVAVQTSHRERHFHATATCGCFGAAAAAASLLELDVEATTNAIGLAGTQAGGLFEFLTRGSEVKRFHPGRAALAGVLAAELAEAGFDGPDTIIEGPEGFAEAFADSYDLRPFESLGEPFEISRTYLKPYPCCRHVHGPIDAAKRFREAGIRPSDVERATVETYRSAAHHDKTAIENLLDAQMSIPYGFAVAFVTGRARLAQFSPPRTGDECVVSLMERATVVESAEMEARYPDTRPVRVTVETHGGDRETELIEYPRGAPENPLTDRELRTKFGDLADGALSDDDVDAVFDAAIEIDSVSDLRAFADRL